MQRVEANCALVVVCGVGRENAYGEDLAIEAKLTPLNIAARRTRFPGPFA